MVTLCVVGCVPHPAVVAVLLHVATDFTFQSPETALRKRERGRYLLVHTGLVCGKWPCPSSWIRFATC